jgi:hypothetical protein
LRVFFKIGGTANPGEDFVAFDSWLTMAAGKAEAEIQVIPLQDNLREGQETVVVAVTDSPLSSVLPYRIDPEHAEATVVIHDADQQYNAPFVAIISPASGATFKNPVQVEFNALTFDPKGAITKLEWFAGDRSIGISEIVFIRPPDPGSRLTHAFTWKNPPVGEYKIVALGVDAEARKVLSDPIRVVVAREEPVPEVVVLGVYATDPIGAEVGENGEPDPAVFKIRRVKGPIEVPLKVVFELSGTARNGVDYQRVSEAVELPPGQESVAVEIKPILDRAIEGDETVIIRLVPPICPAIYPPPPWCYAVSQESGAARAVIKDSVKPVNRPPTVTLLRPQTGAVFNEGQAISIVAEAADSDGKVERLDILADGKVLGSTKEPKLALEWKDANVGSHVLTARAADDQGAETLSGRVVIVVREVKIEPFVRRTLPSFYLPGESFEVQLKVVPPERGTAHTVEDAPPKGWPVSRLSHDGVWDARNGKAKFGPFTDQQERTLIYQVQVPANAQGRVYFEGTSSLDGKSYAVLGDRVLQPDPNTRHPADNAPADSALKSDEVTAYAAAWKNGRTWPISPNPIPVAYVTRAGKLWQNGEKYVYDAKQGPPPECWVTPPVSGLGLAVVRPPVPASAMRRVERSAEGTALVMHIDLPFLDDDMVAALEESAPKGWSVTAVSHDGLFDAKAGVIRWGPFFGAKPRAVSYGLTPKPGMRWLRFAGVLSIDGKLATIQGPPAETWADYGPHLKVQTEGREAGRIRLRLTGPGNQLVRIESSANLADWREIGLRFLDEDGAIDLEESEAEAPTRFYRIRVVEE